MNILNAMRCMFPTGTVIDCGMHEGDALEVHGLAQGMVPQNCEILAHGHARFSWPRARRDIYLVKAFDFLILLRIDAAGPDSADGDFVVSRGYAALEGAQSEQFQATACKRIADLCGSPAGHWVH